MDRSTGDVATTLMQALAGYDAETLGDLLAPDATRWLNLTEEETSRDDLLDLMRLEREHVRSSQFTERSRATTERGFVLQFDCDGVTAGGASFHIPVCLVVEVADGVIVRMDEYANISHVKPLLRELLASGRVPGTQG